MKKEEVRKIGFYMDRLEAAGGNVTLLTDAERLKLRDLLKKWLAEVAGDPVTVRFPSSWGDVRNQYKGE